MQAFGFTVDLGDVLTALAMLASAVTIVATAIHTARSMRDEVRHVRDELEKIVGALNKLTERIHENEKQHIRDIDNVASELKEHAIHIARCRRVAN